MEKSTRALRSGQGTQTPWTVCDHWVLIGLHPSDVGGCKSAKVARIFGQDHLEVRNVHRNGLKFNEALGAEVTAGKWIFAEMK